MSTEQNNGQTLDLHPNHYRSLTSALAEAMEYCLVWQTMDGSTRFNIEDLYEFALAHDKERPLGEHEFYMVSCEGAIGKSPGFEYMTQWLLIPTEEEEAERDVQPLTPPTPPPPPVTPTPTAPTMLFCMNCGKPLVPGNKFCIHCGTKIEGTI